MANLQPNYLKEPKKFFFIFREHRDYIPENFHKPVAFGYISRRGSSFRKNRIGVRVRAPILGFPICISWGLLFFENMF